MPFDGSVTILMEFSHQMSTPWALAMGALVELSTLTLTLARQPSDERGRIRVSKMSPRQEWISKELRDWQVAARPRR